MTKLPPSRAGLRLVWLLAFYKRKIEPDNTFKQLIIHQLDLVSIFVCIYPLGSILSLFWFF